jgi:hypothetical protein
MRYYDTLAEYDRNGFNVIVDKTWEEIDVASCFDDTCFDIQDMRDKINSGQLDWFMLRVRVFVDDIELSAEYLGGMLYDNPSECLTDGSAEDLIHSALESAKDRMYGLYQKFWALSMEVDAERAGNPTV